MKIVVERGRTVATFLDTWAGGLVDLSFRGSRNLIDRTDNGRGLCNWDLIEGWPDQAVMGDPWRQDAINPTYYGGADHYWRGSRVLSLSTSGTTVEGIVEMKDYTPRKYSGPYRKKWAKNWPLTGWFLEFRHFVKGHSVDTILCQATVWHESDSPRFVRLFRCGTFLSHLYFQPPFLQNADRILTSWKGQTVDADFVAAASTSQRVAIGKTVKWKQEGKVEQHIFAHDEKNRFEMAKPGMATVVKIQSIQELMRWVEPGEKLSAEAKVSLVPFIQPGPMFAFSGSAA